MPKLESADYVERHTIHVRFSDGTECDLDLEAEIWGEVFEPLKDPEVFRRFKVDAELNTITWPSGADFAPEFLYARAAEQAAAGDRPPAGG
ncbi:MAG TPA: DUF2442 domain-containing protein [Planctomycetes bacterium]|nr:DUF2442 domain-containing protein [Planctomycetota bacterium]